MRLTDWQSKYYPIGSIECRSDSANTIGHSHSRCSRLLSDGESIESVCSAEIISVKFGMEKFWRGNTILFLMIFRYRTILLAVNDVS